MAFGVEENRLALAPGGALAAGTVIGLKFPRGWTASAGQWQLDAGAGFAAIANQTGLTYALKESDIAPLGSPAGYKLRFAVTVGVITFQSAILQLPISMVAAPFKFASNRTQFPAGVGVISTAGTVYQSDKVTFKAPDDWDTTALVCTFPGFYCGGGSTDDEFPIGNDIPIRNASLFINGVFSKMLKFGGADGVTVPNGGWVQNDVDNTIFIPRGAEYSIVVQTVVPAGQYRGVSYYAQANDGTSASNNLHRDAYVNGTTAFVASTPGAQLYGPCCIVGRGWVAGKKPVPLILGDSIGFCKNDDNALIATEGVFGYVNRAMIDPAGPGRYAYGNFCAPGTKLAGLSDAKFSRRKAILQALGMPFTCIYVEMGVNTIPNALRITDWEGTAGPFCVALAGGKDIIGGTLIPQCVILNNSKGTSTADMTVSSNTQWNNYVMNVGGTRKYFTKYVDNVAPFEDPANPGKWKVPAFNTTLAVALTGVATKDFILSAAPAIDDVIVFNPGNATNSSKLVSAVVDLGDGTFKVSTAFALTATYPVGTVIKATNAEDGTHPTTNISKLGKAPLVAAKAAGIFT